MQEQLHQHKGKKMMMNNTSLLVYLMTETTPLNNPATSSSLSSYLTRPPKQGLEAFKVRSIPNVNN